MNTSIGFSKLNKSTHLSYEKKLYSYNIHFITTKAEQFREITQVTPIQKVIQIPPLCALQKMPRGGSSHFKKGGSQPRTKGEFQLYVSIQMH